MPHNIILVNDISFIIVSFFTDSIIKIQLAIENSDEKIRKMARFSLLLIFSRVGINKVEKVIDRLHFGDFCGDRSQSLFNCLMPRHAYAKKHF